ncbi:hypothetical protein FE697_019540 [Mumia zhuanghuii]|uniref:YciI family protein n=2 Tax=Mumia TaxID=1546255 RepID=A0ABW1QNF2_9ACTN|nr:MULTISPECIES: YciI family protein [Mumia]KAA1420074.1 hypothetical protein FE697_019540 [Mumia zhuanghuii]
MKYMILLYGSQADYDAIAGRPDAHSSITADDVAAMEKAMVAIHTELAESGELVAAHGLSDPVHARRVQVRKGVPVTTDGPYAETEEVLAGLTIIDCGSLDRATEIAARFVNPDADGEYVDVRPIVGAFDDLTA